MKRFFCIKTCIIMLILIMIPSSCFAIRAVEPRITSIGGGTIGNLSSSDVEVKVDGSVISNRATVKAKEGDRLRIQVSSLDSSLGIREASISIGNSYSDSLNLSNNKVDDTIYIGNDFANGIYTVRIICALETLYFNPVITPTYSVMAVPSISDGSLTNTVSFIFILDTESNTPTSIPTKKPTATPTATPTRKVTSTPTPTKKATSTPTATPTKKATSTPIPTKKVSPTPTLTKKATSTPIPTKKVSPTPTLTKKATSTPTPIKTATSNPTPTKAVTETPTVTPTQTLTIPLRPELNVTPIADITMIPLITGIRIDDPIPVPTDPTISVEGVTPTGEPHDEGNELEDQPQVSEWAKEEVEEADKNKLIPTSIKHTRYTKEVTRKEFAAIALRFYETYTQTIVELQKENPFTDTQDEEVLKAFEIGITNGISETEFAPDMNITREQMATMMARALKAAGVDTSVDVEQIQNIFVDHTEISQYALESVCFMAEKEIIKGVGENRFDSKGKATIEQSILISERMFIELK